jgi:hypothetical protein
MRLTVKRLLAVVERIHHLTYAIEHRPEHLEITCRQRRHESVISERSSCQAQADLEARQVTLVASESVVEPPEGRTYLYRLDLAFGIMIESCPECDEQAGLLVMRWLRPCQRWRDRRATRREYDGDGVFANEGLNTVPPLADLRDECVRAEPHNGVVGFL